MVFAEPEPRLRGYVTSYQGFTEGTTGFARRREIPFAGAALIVNFGQPYRLFDPRDPTGAATQHTSFVAGLDDSYWLVEATGPTCGVEVLFTPIGAYRFFGLPMGLLTRRVVGLPDVIGTTGRRLIEQLYDAPTWEACFALLDAVIAARLAASRPPSPGAVWAWQRLSQTHGGVRIDALAAEIGWSRKHLNAQFREQIGLPPKTLARVLRFNRVIRLLEHDGPRWSEIAHACGYYDQAHFNRDFREFSGSAPGEFLGRRLPGGGIIGD